MLTVTIKDFLASTIVALEPHTYMTWLPSVAFEQPTLPT